MKKKINSKFNHWLLLYVFLGITINYIVSRMVIYFDLPVYIDTIGTIFVAATCGYLPGIFVGFLSNVLIAYLPGLIGFIFPQTGNVIEPMTLYYGIINVFIAFISSYFSRIGMFKKWWKVIISIFTFSFIGGVLGSLLTWALYGLQFGQETSAPFVLFLYNKFHFSPFFAQLTGDSMIDLLDKTIVTTIVVLALRFLPNKFLKIFPNGRFHFKKNNRYIKTNNSYRVLDHHRSLRKSVTIIIIAIALTLSSISVLVSFSLYKEKMNNHYYETSSSITNFCMKVLDGDEISKFLTPNSEGKYIETDTYQNMESELINIKNCFDDDIEYIYVYKVMEHNCQVVFDLDTPGLKGEPLGSLIDNEYPFDQEIDKLLEGKEIEPIESNGIYGWLYSKYTPIFDSDGKCVAYLGIDIDMYDVISDRYIFIIEVMSILFGFSIVLIAFVLWFTQIKVIEPINALTRATQDYAFGSDSGRAGTFNAIKNLNIETGNEIESLYKAISKETTDVENYLLELDTKNQYIQKLQDNIIISFAEMVESRDENTGDHVRRTSTYVRILCNTLLSMHVCDEILTEKFLAQVIKSAPLHDIGKIKIPDAILNKPGRLTEEEFAVIKTHTTEGRIILHKALEGIEGDNYLRVACNMAYCHHERYDGKGYPEGIKGDEIPICAKIMAVADVFDALTSKRSYKEPFSIEKSVEIITSEAGKQFDPMIVEAFKIALPEIIKALEQFYKEEI